MPEGPSIVILKEKISYLKHKIVQGATGYADLDMTTIAHKKILDFKSWGKYFLICFSDFTIQIHFGLFGNYQFHEPKKVNPKLALHFNDDAVYFYVCTVKQINGSADEKYDWSADVMSDKWDINKALEKLKAKKNKMICDVLLDQQIFSGVGNIIKNEVLYRCKVHPESIVGNIPAVKLHEVAEESRLYSFDFLKWRRNNELSRHYEVYKQEQSRYTGKSVTKKDTGSTKRISFFVTEEQKHYI